MAAVEAVPVSLPCDFDLLGLHVARPERYPFLLETVASGRGPHARDSGFDILFAFPGETLLLDHDLALKGSVPGVTGAGFLPALDAWWRKLRQAPVPADDPAGVLPFRGGWFLYLGYELAGQIEPSLRLKPGPGGPVAFATRIPVAIVRQRQTGLAWIVAEDTHRDAVAMVSHDLAAATAARPDPGARRPLVTSITEPDPAVFLAAVEKVRRHIAAGDVYQVNLARRWQAAASPDLRPTEIYRRLRQTNPAPFAGFARLGGWSLMSSSPERLVRSRDGIVETRPIAGTRPTADDPALEDSRRTALLAHPKERAEHIMLIDLERNDLGRISEPGTVEVDEFMVVESYAHVHHIVSNVRGRLRPSVSPGVLLAALFPGGTITGCPKVRCMEIISELEEVPRGPYTGSMGYLNRDGSCDLNILIRSIALQDGQLSFAAGSGIVADSDPVRELEETRAKAKGLLLALAG